MSKMKEIWKDIQGYEGLYQVSNLGRIRSLDRYVMNHSKKELRKGAIKNVRAGIGNYLIVDLYKGNQQRTFRVHRLVAFSFIDNPMNKETVNHIDGNVQNNRVDNLEWATPSEQNYHFYKHGLKSKENIDKTVRRMNEANAKKVMCVETGKIYSCIADVLREFNKKPSGLISRCCKDSKRTAYGFHWQYI